MKKPVIHRFVEKISLEPSDCLVWMGCISGGYGYFSINSKRIRAHRWFYEYFNGPIPDGLVLDHKCRNRACVNPEHLRMVTPRINALENNIGATAKNSMKTHCIRGHELTPDNVYRRPANPTHRYCRECIRMFQRQSYYVRKQRISP